MDFRTARKIGGASRRFWMVAALGAAVLVLGNSCTVSKPGPESFARDELKSLSVSASPPPAPTAAFLDPAGKTRTLADWRGQVVVVNLWATWCEPCRAEMPTLATLAERFKGRDVAILPISVDKPEDRDLAFETLRELAGARLSLYQARSYDIAFDAQAQGFPTTIIYGRDGKEIARLSGGADWAGKQAQGLLEWALSAPAALHPPASPAPRAPASP